jgi:sugar phosphate permease
MSDRSLLVIIASFLTVLIGLTIRNTYGILLPEMLPSLMISKTEAGLIYSSFFVAYTIFSPLLGLLADTINIRVLLTIFSIILGIGTFFMGYASSLAKASFFFAVAGIGASASWSPVVALVQRWTSNNRRGLVLAFIDAGGALGLALSALVMPIIVVSYDWRMGWKVLGILAFLIAIINFSLVRDHTEQKYNVQYLKLDEEMDISTRIVFITILGDFKFWFIGVSYLLLGFSVIIPLTFISTYAVQELMFPYEIATKLTTIMAVTSIFGKLILGFLSDIIGRIRVMILCEILIVIGSLGITIFNRLLAIQVSAGIFGIGYGAIFPLYAACASDYFSEKYAGSIVGLWSFLLGIGSILSPVISGWIADFTGRLTFSFVLGIVTTTISMFLLLSVKLKGSSPKSVHKR